MQKVTAPDVHVLALGHALLDTRSDEAFAAGHLPGSGHIPASELTSRRSELPPREAPVLVVAGNGSEAAADAACLESLGYSSVLWLDAPLSALTEGHADQSPAARLWRPSPFLEEVLPLLPAPSPETRVLDLAAGAGREAVFLALHGYRVDAWDHDGDVLEKARALGRRHGVEIETTVKNLEYRHPEVPSAAYQLVMTFRFLHRPLFPAIAGAIRPGGWVIYETFLRGQERFGRPRHPRFLLDPEELPRHFPGFAIERYEERTPPEGPWLARLLARKPG